MDLSVIRNRLNSSSHMHYHSPEEFVADVLLMFKNCGKFNYVSETHFVNLAHTSDQWRTFNFTADLYSRHIVMY